LRLGFSIDICLQIIYMELDARSVLKKTNGYLGLLIRDYWAMYFFHDVKYFSKRKLLYTLLIRPKHTMKRRKYPSEVNCR